MEALIAGVGVGLAFGVGFLAQKFDVVIRWCKWAIAYTGVYVSRRSGKKRFDWYDMESFHDPIKIGLLPPAEEIILESPQDQIHLKEGSDEIFLYGVNSSKEWIVIRMSRSSDQEVEALIYLKLRDGRSFELHDSRQRPLHSKPSDRVYSCGGLKMHYIEPMRKWRIFFRGLMTDISEDGKGKMIYVKFALQWRSTTDCFDTLSDVKSSDLAKAFARTKWTGNFPKIPELHNAMNSYTQAGIIRGEVSIDGNKNEEIYLFGQKIRYLGNSPTLKNSRFSHLSGWITKNGSIVHFTEISIPGVIRQLLFGYMVTPEGKIVDASNIKMVKGSLSYKSNAIELTFHADDSDYSLESAIQNESSLPDFKSEDDYVISMKPMLLKLNTLIGAGFSITGNILNSRKNILIESPKETESLDTPAAVSFSDILCQNSAITGGKGSSLAVLTELSKKYKSFTVPAGIVMTTKAYEKFLTKKILKEVKGLEDTLYGNLSGDIKEACKSVADAIIETDISKDVENVLVECLVKEFGSTFQQKKFAVRSSATGEDTDDMSAAGQMETYLGIIGLEQIIRSVKKCWASQFGYVAAQYKKQNGQVLNSPMAVVIQEMVSCDIAGVLFTCDPLTGNPTIMTITSNYGLGESVVSGSEEPDTIQLKRDAEDNLKVTNKIIGSKSHRFVLTDKEGTRLEDVPETERNACSLTDDSALQLGRVAINIEKSYDSSRDIEWGFHDRNLYVFQSRPVTNNSDESDYEIDHESDAAMRVEKEFFTIVNVGEIMPGATSPLGSDMMIKFFNASMQRGEFWDFDRFSPIFNMKGIVSMYGHTMMMAADAFQFPNEGENVMKSVMISVFGRIIENEDLFTLVRERYGKMKLPLKAKVKALFKTLLLSKKMLEKTRKKYENYEIPVEKFKTAHTMFDALLHACTNPVDALICHMKCTTKSQMANMFLMSTLEKAKGALDSDVYNDISALLASINEVESADVPSAMETLAFFIAKDINAEEFQKMNLEDAENWLMSSSSESGIRFRDFLKKHGHRCLKELDMRQPTWGEKPQHLIKILQRTVGSVKNERKAKKVKSFQEIGLKTPLSRFNRFLIEYILLPLSRSGVQGREASKSLLIKTQNEWRRGYRRLGKLMVAEGRIPDADLIYFMTVLEIKELLRSRNPKIISRALHRRRRFPILDGYIFPEISYGIPKPINMDNDEEFPIDENLSMKGFPVSQGVAKGYVRVALTLEEAAHLKPGEILLTYTTDIGWTPYFPTLGGVVTEIGGLISHGAVVSREYGLPCVCGLHGVTRMFKTGDYVLLDGNRGILQKLPNPD